MPFATDTKARLEDTQAQVARLRAQVEALVREVGPAFSDAASKAEAAVTNATGVTREQAKAALGGITLAQVGLVVAAAAAGWVVGRVMR
jgi:hypothetical protein